MGVFDAIKGAVWEEDPKKPKPQQPEVVPAPTVAPQTIKPGWTASATMATPTVDPGMKMQILAELDKATPDVLKAFNTMVASFASLPMDDATRIQSAYIAFKAARPGDSSAKILQAMAAREAALPALRVAFDAEMKDVQKQITKLESQLNELKASLAAQATFEAAYQDVAAEIQQHKQLLQALKG